MYIYIHVYVKEDMFELIALTCLKVGVYKEMLSSPFCYCMYVAEFARICIIGSS